MQLDTRDIDWKNPAVVTRLYALQMLVQCGPLIWSTDTWFFRLFGQFFVGLNQHQPY